MDALTSIGRVSPVTERPLVLIVEDTPLVGRVYAQMLQSAGYRVETATTVTTAVGLARALGPEAILLDWHLGRTDGALVIRELKASEETRAIPVVVITAWDTEQMRRAARIAGAKGFLTKPCDLETLSSELKRVTAGH